MNSDPHSLTRVMALHAMLYCERLFYLEEVEEIRVADKAVFAGRRMHEELDKKRKYEQGEEWAALELESETIGLRGKMDCVRRSGEQWIPVEHKKGRSCSSGKQSSPWPSDLVQVAAYAMLIEDNTGQPVSEARVYYHADNRMVKVPIDDKARKLVRDAVARARELRESTKRPPVCSNPNLCTKCSLAPVCLPEEERKALDAAYDSIRLFPPDMERKTIHVMTNGAQVKLSGENLVVQLPDGEKSQAPIADVGEIVLHGNCQITTQAIRFCVEKEVGIHWFSGGGYYIGGITPGAGAVQRKIRQYEALRDNEKRLAFAKQLAMARAEGQLKFILRSTRGEENERAGMEPPIEEMRAALQSMAHAGDVDTLRGFEGQAALAYFSMLPKVLGTEAMPDFAFSGRNRRPPKDRFNALISFGYSLLYRSVLQAIIVVGLEPAFGFYHTPRSSAHPLVLDIMELFRVPLVDMPFIASIHRNQWDTQNDFDIQPGQVYLTDSGRKKAIGIYEKRLQDSWKHPVVNYSMTYARLIELEVRLLEKEWTGKPGMFAKMRLR